MPMTAQLIGFAAPPLGESVSILTVGLGHRPSSEIVRSRIHTPLPILPFRVPSLIRPPQNFRPGAYLPGFRPSSRLHRQRLLTAASTQLLLRSVLRFSQPLDGLLRYQLSGLVSSRCHVQGFLPVQGVLSSHGDLPSSGRLTSMLVRVPSLTGLHRLPRQHLPASRLRSV